MQTTGTARRFRVTRGGVLVMRTGEVWTARTGDILTAAVLAGIVAGMLEIVAEV